MDRESLVSAIDAFQMQYGTAIGNAIVVCLAELFPDDGINLGDMTFGPRQKARGRDEKQAAPPKEITPVAPGSYGSAAILLLSDGRRTTGVDTLEAAKMAADRGVRIHVVGPGHGRRPGRRGRRPGHLHAARRADPARGGAHDRRRVPPRRHARRSCAASTRASARACRCRRARPSSRRCWRGRRRCWCWRRRRCRCFGTAASPDASGRGSPERPADRQRCRAPDRRRR